MDKISILDNGSQYTHLIATKIRNKLHVYSEILPPDVKAAKLEGSKGIILSGSPSSVYDENAPPFNAEVFELGIPVLGLCYGLHLMAHHLNGKVKPGNVKEYGVASLDVERKELILKGMNQKEQVWMSHGDTVEKLPRGFSRFGFTADCKYAAVGDAEKKIYGLQFHPEVEDTLRGKEILENFVVGISGSKQEWTIANFIDSKVDGLKEQAKGKDVFLLVSGGVDSTVSAALLEKALGPDRVFALHIDNGLMRKNESEDVVKALKKVGFKNVSVVDASEQFFKELGNETEPEKKRKIIGKTFIDVSNAEAERFGLKNWLLGQGTIYPDTIESGGTKHADVIKTHHNRVAIIQQMIADGKIIEPISDLYKAEVRELDVELGLPAPLLYRHPFPGPGLGIRALCSGSDQSPKEISPLTEQAARIAAKSGLNAVVLPIKSVGVKGDARSYEYPVALEGKCDWKTLESASTRITNEVRGINRAVYCLAPEHIRSAELVKATITKERMSLLREADFKTMQALEESGFMKTVWQCPTILAPVRVNGRGESIILRPVYSERAMTARFSDLPPGFVKKLAADIASLDGVGAVFYDITHKPPGTIEWE